jgi:antitoxin ParD1/3/4
MTISLTPELEKLVEEKVTSGLYPSAGEVVREALQLLQERDERLRLEELRQKIQIGIEQLDAGRSVTLDEETLASIKRRGRERLAKGNGEE